MTRKHKKEVIKSPMLLCVCPYCRGLTNIEPVLVREYDRGLKWGLYLLFVKSVEKVFQFNVNWMK